MADDGPEVLEFLLLAKTGPGPWPHPVEVALHPAGADSRMSFSLGPHAANVGGQIPLARVLDDEQRGLRPSFDEEFTARDLHWLVPHLVRLQGGEDVTADIVDAYRRRHGRYPPVRGQERFGS